MKYFILALFICNVCYAHDGVHDEWYSGLNVPGTAMLCCSKQDCRPVSARIRPDGKYEVWVDKVTFPDSPYSLGEGGAPDAWVVVPEEAILHGKENPTGAPVACWYNRVVRCFIPGVGT